MITSLDGRSQASAVRAAKAGVEVVDDDGALIAQADFVFSIVPPSRAAELAQRLLPRISAASNVSRGVLSNATPWRPRR